MPLNAAVCCDYVAVLSLFSADIFAVSVAVAPSKSKLFE
jgi:hypothetical protein